MDAHQLKNIIEAALLAAERPLSICQLARLLGEERAAYSRDAVREALETLEVECRQRGVELKRVGSGYRFQVRQELSVWVSRLWEE
ncbi:MAG: SMC-Scp complex subunit ScpB, partial [Pseudomonadota bacterium]|nr:SMC-Scp complex subunit ScpB [Pseudomonadota bacterium]